MARVELKDLCKVYPGNVVAVKNANLVVNDKEFVVLVGPSGCGKSTTLRMIAGLEEITSGTLALRYSWLMICLQNRDIAMVFQNYAHIAHDCL